MTDSQSDPDGSTHFGFSEVPLSEKQDLVDDVFHKVARRYDVMNDLMSGGLHRLWKDTFAGKVNARNRKDFRHLDVAGGTGDVAFRIAKLAPADAEIVVLDINGDMLEVGRDRAREKGIDGKLEFVQANAESLPFPDNHFDAYTIAFGIRNVPRIQVALEEAYRVLKPGGRFLCLEFSHVERAGARQDLRGLFLQCHSGRRQARRGRRRALSLSRGIDPPIPGRGRFRAHDPQGGLPPHRL